MTKPTEQERIEGMFYEWLAGWEKVYDYRPVKDCCQAFCSGYARAYDELEAENQRLREALQAIGSEASSYYGCRCDTEDCGAGDCWSYRMMCIADSVIETLEGGE